MNRITLFILLFVAVQTVHCQKFLKKLKEAVEEQLEDTEAADLFDKEKQIAKMRADQLEKDTSNYNYIFSQGNRASFFANREGKESLLLTLSKNYEDEETEPVKLERYEEVFDQNRLGEKSMYLAPKAAFLNFIRALNHMTNRSGYGQAILDTAFSITELVDIDTLNQPEKYALGKTVANLSILVHAQGRYNVSKDFIDKTTLYFKEVIGVNTIALASLYNNHAVIAQSQGNFTEAEDYFNQAEEVLKSKGRSGTLSHAIVTSNRALLYNELGQFEEAKLAIQKAIDMAEGEIREKGRDNTSFKINQGLIFYTGGAYSEAESLFREILELKEKRMGRNQTDYANVENYLAATLMASGNTAEVPGLLQDALRIFGSKYSTNHPAYIKTQHNLGKYYLISDKLSEASSTLLSVNEAYLNYFGDTHPDYLNSLEDLAVVAWKQSDYTTATNRFNTIIDSHLKLVENYFGAMSEYEKSQYWDKVRPSILKFYAYVVNQANDDPSLLSRMYDIHLKTKGVLLSASTKVREEILSGSDEELKKLYNEWVSIKEDILLYYSYSKAQLEELEIDLPATESKANQIEKELNKRSTTFAQANKLPATTLADVKSKLTAQDAAIEIIGYPVFERTYTGSKNYAFLIATNDKQHPELVLIENGEELDTKYAKAYLNMIKLKAKDRITYEKFWRPIDENLMGKKNLHVSLDGIYFQVNIGALQRLDDTYVSDSYRLNLYTSTRDLVKKAAKPSVAKKAMLFGYPNYGSLGLLTELPGTKAEIEAIGKITKSKGFNTTSYLANEATEENFKKIKSPTVLHIATHGFFMPENQTKGDKVFGVEVSEAKENPLLRSGLMLANAEQTMNQTSGSTEVNTTNNGVLTAYEVINLDLKGTDVVVLSACETGLGEIKSGEGVYGLQRSFQVAGANTVVMSLWKVSDDATMKLMTTFYQNWMSGQTKEVAFSNAQKQLRIDYPEPYYWGAFVMLN